MFLGQSASFTRGERFRNKTRVDKEKQRGTSGAKRKEHDTSESDAGRGARRAGDGGEGVGSYARARLPYRPGSYLLGELLPLGRAVDDLDGQHGSRRGGRLALARVFSSGGHRAESRAEVPGLERRRRLVNSTARATGALARHARLLSSLGDRGARGRAVRAREWRRRVARASRREKNKRLVWGRKKLPAEARVSRKM